MNTVKHFLDELLEEPNSSIDLHQASEWSDFDFVDRFFGSNRDGFYDLQDEITFIGSQLSEGPFLDLGSGRERLAGPLSNKMKGFALDKSLFSLRGNTVPSICADYHQLPIKGQFGSILLGYGQICFCEKSKLVDLLKRCKKLLKRKGKIYLDLPTIDAIQSMHSHGEWEFIDQNFQELLFTSRYYNPDSGIFSQKLLNINQTTGNFRTTWIHYQMYSLYELLELFKDLRLQVNYGAEDLDESPIKEESPWMIFVLQKP